VLDLGDLDELFDENRFQPGGAIFKYFFAGDLARFNISLPNPVKTRNGKPRPPRLNKSVVFEAIGDGKAIPKVVDIWNITIHKVAKFTSSQTSPISVK
jgi:hypothetical protein